MVKVHSRGEKTRISDPTSQTCYANNLYFTPKIH